MSEAYICELVERDPLRMNCLRAAAALELPDWWIGGGFLRNFVWDRLSGLPDGPINDIDVIYFDPANQSTFLEKAYEIALRTGIDFDWSVKNQARMHVKNNNAPYTSSLDAMSHWVETATAVGVTLRDDRVVLGAPLGIEDLMTFTVRKAPRFPHNDIYQARWREKGWKERWPTLRIIEE